MSRVEFEPTQDQLAHRLSLVERLALAPFEVRRAFFRNWRDEQRQAFWEDWLNWARPGQLPPKGDWRVWLLMAGRGYGKTRAGAQWIHHLAEEPGLKIALVGPTIDEARTVMVEGPSGVLATARATARPRWEPTLGRLIWPSGTEAQLFSGANGEALRGPEHDYAWCDELAKWSDADAAWDNLMFGLRRGVHPRVLATTTPRQVPLLRALVGRTDVAMTRGRTADNGLLAPGFLDYVTGLYGGTRLGRQELDGELIEDVEGSLWPRELIERCRAMPPREGSGEAEADGGPAADEPEASRENLSGSNQSPSYHQSGSQPPHLAMARQGLRRVVVGVDPPASAGGDACGIVVCGLGGDGIGYVLADATVRGLRPEGWARAAVRAAERWDADRVVVENNQGGDMVESVLRGVDSSLPVRPARAIKGKTARAEPVATFFESGRAKFAGVFPALEDELAGMTIDGRYEGPGRSPDRADAMVWALTELLREAPMPRIGFIGGGVAGLGWGA